MPKYLFRASYTADGAKGLMSEGGSGRVEVVARLAEGLGGKLESYYVVFGKTMSWGSSTSLTTSRWRPST
jgi:uncharacterized protein with GYD domain